MAQIVLLIFDEAHHCARDHPANRIMKSFYHPLKAEKGPASIPHVLGLSASPILRSKISELERIESNLDSISITPRVHRQEMLKHVNRPMLYRLEYEPHDRSDSSASSEALVCLREICNTLNNRHKPIIHNPIPQKGLLTSAQLKQLRLSRLENHLAKFCNKAVHIYEELGPWAADYFILESITALEKLNELETDMFGGVGNEEKATLLRTVKQGPLLKLLANRSLQGPFQISSKVERLISVLDEQDHSQCSGLLFVRQRTTVSVLCTLLSIHPKTKDRFHCATFVGMSNNAAKRYTMAELLDLKAQRQTLAEFRARQKNLVIATDVLEEGIDVTACNLVICFDPPPNVKSFIQRRGRARQEKSKFVIMFPNNEGFSKLESWRSLEESLIRAYQSEMRQIKDLADIEDNVEEVPGKLEVESTGACLTPGEAVAHINHFCARLPHEPYVDLRPVYTFEEQPFTKLITATVTLPNCLIPSLRSTRGTDVWRTERAAGKDAAFQAYIALRKAGLLNDHLLPLSHAWGLEEDEPVASMLLDTHIVSVQEQLNPWATLAQAWSWPNIHQTRISLRRQGSHGEGDLYMVLTTPSQVPCVSSFQLYWDEDTTFSLHFDAPQRASLKDPDTVQVLQHITHLLSRSTRSDNTTDDRTDFIALFSPLEEESQLATWYESNRGRVPAVEKYQAKDHPTGFVRTPSQRNAPYLFLSWSIIGAELDHEMEVDCIPLPRRRQFLVPNTLSISNEVAPSKLQSFPIEDCTVDRLPFQFGRFSLFIPAIARHLERFLIADELCETILKDVSIKDKSHIVTAISAPSSDWITNYQQYEFVGDTVLKFIVCHQLFCDHGNWHEGYLSAQKNRMVSNNRLANAALSKSLDQYIMTENVKSRKRSPVLISEMKSDSSIRRTISTKVLADVVEALVGAAYIDSNFNAARKCVHAFLPEIGISTPQFPSRPTSLRKPITILQAEWLIGREFQSNILLQEALTHPSCDSDMQTESYQRLEFLGDAVLDMLVVSMLAAQQSENALSQGKMTLVKSALVNKQFLGFLCLDFSHDEDMATIVNQPDGSFAKQTNSHKRYLWQLMRHSNTDIARAQCSCLERYATLCDEIKRPLNEGNSYPWLQLTRLNPDKFFSDMVESLLGAIFIDSAGSLEDCCSFIMRIGLVPYLSRVVTGEVNVSHPKAVLQKLAGAEAVEYEVHIDEGKKYKCVVKVGGVEIAEVRECLCQEEAVVAGAMKTIETIRSMR